MNKPKAKPEMTSSKIRDGGTSQTYKPYRPRTAKATSFIMSRVRSTDTQMEVKLRSSVHRLGLRFRNNVPSLLSKPDIVFMKEKVAVLIDGDFWHARILGESGVQALRASLRTDNREFSVTKLQGNYNRDVNVTTALEGLSWIVVRLWGSELKRNMNDCIQILFSILKEECLSRTSILDINSTRKLA
jgi:DNA mismatch endonuclease (patch repair protein)